jgi:subtilisin-like proprotein convertase family protein
LKHTYIGDLVITVEPPSATGATPIMLHNRAGGANHDITRIYDKTSVPGLAAFAGKACDGTWTLRIRDAAAQDSGVLVSFSLRLSFLHQERVVAPAPEAAAAKPIRKRTARKRN